MACDYFIDDKKYSEKEFKQYLLEKGYDDFVSESAINPENLKEVIPPTPPTEQQTSIYAERPATELSFRGLQDVSNEFGYEDVKSRERVSDIQEKQNAINTITDWKEKGNYDRKVESLLSKIENRETVPTASQRLLLQQHLADERAKLRSITDKNSNEFNQQLAKVKRIKEVGTIARQEAGAALRIGDTRSIESPLDNYEDAFIAKQESLDVEELTPEQKQQVEATVKEYEEKQKIADEKIADLENKLAEMEAEKEIKKTKPASQRKSKEDYAKIRENLAASIKEKWNNAGKDGTLTAVPFPYAKQIAAIAPDVLELVKSYVDEGITNLQEIKDKVRGIIPELTDKDVNDIIRGEYSKKKPPLTELQKNLQDLRTEAKLLEELERVRKGEPKNEQQSKEKTERIKQLQDELAKIKKEEGHNDETKLKSIKSRNEAEIKRIEEKIKNKDFSQPEKKLSIFDDKELQKKYPKLYAETLDAIKAKEDVKQRYDLELLRDEISRETKLQKAGREAGRIVNTLKAIKTGIDLSGIGIQTLYSTLARPKTGIKAIAESFQQLASKKKFDRWLTELHNSEMYPLMQKSGLAITEPNTLKGEAEEAFSGRYKSVKIKGKEYDLPDKILAPFERAFTSLSNASRALAFTQFAQKYLDQGYTFEKNPELFKSLAERLNTQTGRGKLNEKIQASAELVSKGIWSPRLMASRLNMLGISDLVGTTPIGRKLGTKGFYSQLYPIERKQALKDVTQGITAIVAVSAALALSTGGELDKDPFSSTFMTIKWDNGKSVNLTGGLSSYIRYIFQIASGKERKEDKFKDVNRIDKALRFLRGKTPPLTGAVINVADEKDYMGKPTSIGQEAAKLVVPISMENVVKDLKDEGAVSLLKNMPEFLVSSTGFNIRDQKEFDAKDDSLNELLERNLNSKDQELDEIKNNRTNKPISEKEKERYIKERDAFIEKRLKLLWQGKDTENKMQDDNGRTKYVPFSEMTRKEIERATTNIKTEATRETKRRLFGKPKTYKVKQRL